MAGADVFPADRQATQLIALYRRAQVTLAKQVRDAILAGNMARADNRRQQLLAVAQFLERLGVQADRQATKLVADAYQQSALLTGQRLHKLGATLGKVNAATFTGINEEAITLLQDQLLGRLADARRTIGRQVADVFADAGRRSTMLALLGSSGSYRAATADMVDDLRTRGVTAFVDRAGREWNLGRYAEMAVRTTTRQAVVEGAKLRMASAGVDLARITTHASSCKICLPWEGVLVSLDGATSELDGEPVATFDAMPNGGPPFHPNCRHSIKPVVPELARLQLAAA